MRLFESLPDPADMTRRMLEGAQRGRLELPDEETSPWMASFARLLFGPRGPVVGS